MTILHLISSGGMYGAEAVILNLSRTLNEGGHTSVVAVFSNSSQPNGQFHERALGEGLEVHAVPCRGQFDWTVPAAIRNLVRSSGAEVLHAHGYKADVYAWLALRGSAIPLVSTCHTWYDNDFALRMYGQIDRWVLRRFAGVVAVSDEVKQKLLDAGVTRDQVHLIRNGIDLRPFHFAERFRASRDLRAGLQTGLRVGLVGRLSREKGVDLFFHAAALVLTELPETEFVVVGDGPDRSALKALIEALGIGGRATLYGRCDDMPSFYASLDLLVSSSRQEGLPIALLEGMASGLAVVATAVGAVPEIIQNDQTGWLVAAENITALAQTMLAALRDPALRVRFGKAACDRVRDQFSAERMTSEYLQVYQAARGEAAQA